MELVVFYRICGALKLHSYMIDLEDLYILYEYECNMYLISIELSGSKLSQNIIHVFSQVSYFIPVLMHMDVMSGIKKNK